jgi:hypothetical protein
MAPALSQTRDLTEIADWRSVRSVRASPRTGWLLLWSVFQDQRIGPPVGFGETDE